MNRRMRRESLGWRVGYDACDAAGLVFARWGTRAWVSLGRGLDRVRLGDGGTTVLRWDSGIRGAGRRIPDNE